MDFMFFLTVVGGIILVAAVSFVVLACLAIFISAISPEHDHEHFDYEDFYPDKKDKHHK